MEKHIWTSMDQTQKTKLKDQNDGLKITNVMEVSKKAKENENGAKQKLQENMKERLSLTNVDSEKVQILKPDNLGKNKVRELVKLQSEKTEKDKEDAEKENNNTKETEEKNQAKKKNEASTTSNSNSNSNNGHDDKTHDKKVTNAGVKPVEFQKQNESVNNNEGKATALQNEKTNIVQTDRETKTEDKKIGGDEKKKEVSGNSEREDVNDNKNKSPLQRLQSNKWILLGALGSLLVLVAGVVLKVMNTQKKSQTEAQEQKVSRIAENKELEK